MAIKTMQILLAPGHPNMQEAFGASVQVITASDTTAMISVDATYDAYGQDVKLPGAQVSELSLSRGGEMFSLDLAGERKCAFSTEQGKITLELQAISEQGQFRRVELLLSTEEK